MTIRCADGTMDTRSELFAECQAPGPSQVGRLANGLHCAPTHTSPALHLRVTNRIHMYMQWIALRQDRRRAKALHSDERGAHALG